MPPSDFKFLSVAKPTAVQISLPCWELLGVSVPEAAVWGNPKLSEEPKALWGNFNVLMCNDGRNPQVVFVSII